MTDSKYFTTTKKGTVCFIVGSSLSALYFCLLPAGVGDEGGWRPGNEWQESHRAFLTLRIQKFELLMV